MNWLDYREKLGAGFNDREKYKYFCIKIFNVLDGMINRSGSQIDEAEYYTYCNTTGTPMRQGRIYNDGFELIINELHDNRGVPSEFLSRYIAFINCQKDNKYKNYTREDFKTLVCNMLSESRLQYELIEDTDGVFIFPKGVPEFDDALVSAPLCWLNQYPLAEKAWSKALREYSEGSLQNASDIADLFRKALEAFFQEFFGSSKNLENYKSEYGSFLKQSGVPSEISNNFETILQAYTRFIDIYAKHRDATSDKVLEYLMYQTGNIMRLLITLKQEESASSN